MVYVEMREMQGQTGLAPLFSPEVGTPSCPSRNFIPLQPRIQSFLILSAQPMARFARVVVVDVAHHVTQRGNARQVILSSDGDRAAYLDLLRHFSQLHGLAVLGYCLMSITCI
jgi:hypothetical protein